MPVETNYLAAFTLGLFGAVHCWGMCGGIITALALNLPEQVRNNRALTSLYVLAYNLGRISSYTLAGVMVGASSRLIFSYIDPATAHVILVSCSALILTLLGLYIAGWFPQLNRVERLGTGLWKILQPLGKRLIPVKSPAHAYVFGLIWGWLPCGLVYSALIFALSAGSTADAAAYMFLYGLGTLPAVMGAGIFTGFSAGFLRQPVTRRILGIVLIGFASWNVYGLFYGSHAQHQHHRSDSLQVAPDSGVMDHAHHQM